MKRKMNSLRRWTLVMYFASLLMITGGIPVFASLAPDLPGAPQQEKRVVKGLVTEKKNGEPLPGVTILVKGTTVGVVTDVQGHYSIQLPVANDVTLVFSSMGFKTQEIKVGTKTTIDVVLDEDTKALEEVVVVGYQSVQKRNVTGSVSSVRGEALADIPAASITELLAGKVTGLQSLNTGGGPGGRTAMVIRGSTVISGNLAEANEFSDPLYVIDGVPTDLRTLAGYDATNSDYLASLNPDDVESIDILKDASAAAIYGSRGANGVIIIKTKAGKPGKMTVTARATYGVNLRPELKGVLAGSAERKAKMDMIANSWSYGGLKNYLPMMLTDSLNPAFNNNVDYQGLFYQTGVTQDYSLGVSGGREDLNYRLSVGYYNEKGIVKATGLDRFSLQLNLSQKFLQSIRNQTIIRLSYTDRKTGTGDDDGHKTFPMSIQDLRSSLFTVTDEQIESLTGQLEGLYNKNRAVDVSFSNIANWDIWKGITLNSQVGLIYNQFKKNYHQPSSLRSDEQNYANYYWAQTMSASIETYLSYTKDINKNHSVNVLLGHSFDYSQNETMSFYGLGGTSDLVHTITGFNKDQIDGNTYISRRAMVSYWARAGYRLMDRYLLDLNFRRDASSRFGSGNRWANFPAVSVGWIFSEEPFMAWAKNWLSFGKLKFSYGRNGKQFNSDNLRYNMYTLGYNGMGSYAGKIVNKTYNGITAVTPDFSQLADNKLSWEKSTQWNLGVELEFLQRRIYANFDCYNRRTDDLLFSVYFPGYTGFNQVQANVAGIMNYGYEISLDAYVFDRASKFQIQLQPGISHNQNLVTKLPNGDRDYLDKDNRYGYMVGRPGPVYYGMEYVGPLDKLTDLPVNPFTGKPLDPTKNSAWGTVRPGYPIFVDYDGDYVINDDDNRDLHIIDKSANPKVQGFLNLVVSYKQLRLRVNNEFIFGRDVFDQVSQTILSRYHNDDWQAKAAIDLSKYSFWTGEGSGGYLPALRPTETGKPSDYAFRNTSMFWEKGDYWKIRDITLSYNFDQSWIKKIGLQQLYVYGTVYNVYQWQKSKTIVDVTAVDSRGYTYGDGYPQARKFVFGINVQF